MNGLIGRGALHRQELEQPVTWCNDGSQLSPVDQYRTLN